MKTTTSSRTQTDVISQLRFPLIVLVTFSHSYGAVRPDYSLLTSGWCTYEVLKLLISQTLVKVAVPVFFVISGYLFFRFVEVWTAAVYWQKMRRRVKNLLLPYIVWNLLMAVKLHQFDWDIFWVFWRQAGVQVDWLGNLHLMTAPANMPLWFLRDLMVVSLLTPLIYIGVRRLGLWLMGILAVFYLSGVYAFIPGLSAYSVFFFTLGSFLGIRRLDLDTTMRRIEWPTYGLSVVLAVAMILTYHMPVFSSIMLCFRITGCVATINLASRLLSVTDRRLSAVVCASSYFIYLAHFVFFFSFIDKALIWLSGDVGSLHYLLAPLVKVAVLLAIYAAYHYFMERKMGNLLMVYKKMRNFVRRI